MFPFKIGLGLLSFLGSSLIHYPLTLAQVTPDQSLGSESAIVIPFSELLQLIQGGAIRGENLFQSFQDFSISEGQTIILSNPDGVNNLLIRVTGDNPSNLLGTLGLIKESTINNLLMNLPNLSEINLSNLISLQDLGTANIFFLNPNGILFGENASLNVGGSFIATTANQINFADGTIFSANLAQSSPLLTVSTPIGLQFTQTNSQPITVQGKDKPLNRFLQSITPDTTPEEVNNLTKNILTELLSRPVTLSPEGEIESIDSLYVLPNNTLALIGGDINLEGGFITALGGRIEVGSVMNGGNVSLTPVSNGWQLGFEGIEKASQGNINLNQLALINPDILGSGNGEINIQGKTLNLTNESAIISFTLSNGDAKDIQIKAEEINLVNGSILSTGTINQDTSGKTTIIGNSGNLVIETNNLTSQLFSFIGNVSFNSQGLSGDIRIQANHNITIDSAFIRAVNVSATKGGDIFLQARNFNVINGGLVSTETEFTEGGDIIIQVSDSINLNTFDFNNPAFSIISTDTSGRGDAGNINIYTKNLFLGNRGVITAETEAVRGEGGEGGAIFIEASDLVSLQGFPSSISTGSLSIGNAGNLNILTKRLELNAGAFISTSTLNQGQGGNLTINASDAITLTLQDFTTGIFSTTQGEGSAGNIDLTTSHLSVINGALISAATRRNGKGGFIQINADSLTLDNNSQITTLSQGEGNAGNINLNITGLFTAQDGLISANANQASGGEINIVAQDIRLSGNSDIRTNVETGEGGGGNITLTANSIINFNDSDILAFARDGRGGDIRLNTPVFFGNGYQPTSSVSDPNILNHNGRVDINASGAVAGVIFIPDLTFIQNSLVQLPDSLIDPEKLISNRCIVPESSQRGQLTITGAGGLPSRPGDSGIAPYPTGTVQEIPNVDHKPTWKKGDPIIEPQGIYRSPEGKLLLSRACFD